MRQNVQTPPRHLLVAPTALQVLCPHVVVMDPVSNTPDSGPQTVVVATGLTTYKGKGRAATRRACGGRKPQGREAGCTSPQAEGDNTSSAAPSVHSCHCTGRGTPRDDPREAKWSSIPWAKTVVEER